MILGLIQQKGGCTKTTCVLNLAHAMALEGQRVLVIDADPQRTAATWLSMRDDDAPAPFTVIELTEKTIHRQIESLRRGYDAVVIDGPPRNADVMRSAIAACTHVVVPVQPSAADLWAAETVVDLIGEVQVLRPELKAAYALTRVPPGTVLGREFHKALDESALPILKGGTVQRVAYAEALSAAQTVFEYAKDEKAAADVTKFLNAIKGM